MHSNEMTTKEIMDVITHYKQEDPFHISFQAFRPLLDKLGVGQIVMVQIFRGEARGENLIYESGEPCVSEPLVLVHPCNDEMVWRAMVYRPAALPAWDEDQQFGIRMFLELTFVYGSNSILYKTAFEAMNFDKETCIPNLYSFSKFAMQLIAQKRIQNYAAMYINVKNFKLVNKAFGFQMGTRIMACFAQSSLNFVEEDERLARLGGDNYVALIKKKHLPIFLEQMKNVPVSTTIDGKHIDYHFAVRAGIYLLNENIHLFSELMNGTSRAVALTRRDQSSDYVYYDESVENTMMHHSELEVAMEAAMENESFLVYYQPKVSTKEKKLVGAEALVRWDYFGKILSPFEFIPIFEQTGFIMKVDFYVLNRVCHALRTWMDHGVDPVPISVNFSRAHLSSPDLAERIRAVIRSYNIPTNLVEIEFTETAYISESENLSRTVNGLKEAGIAVSMDDFGTGYSSLCLLQDLMFDVLKIDKSLIGNMENSRKAIVLEHIIAMAKELKMYVVCEGVESVENLKFLENTTCDMIQGYLFDRPLPQVDFEQRLTHKQYPDPETSVS